MAVAMDFTDVIKPIIGKCELASKSTTTNYTKITWDTTTVVTDDPTFKKAKKIEECLLSINVTDEALTWKSMDFIKSNICFVGRVNELAG